MSMEELEKDLAELQQTMPTLEGRLSRLAEKAKGLLQAMEDVKSPATALSAKLDATQAEVTRTLGTFHEKVEEAIRKQEEASTQLIKDWTEARPQLEEGEKTFEQAAERLVNEAGMVDDLLNEALEKIDDAGDAAQDAADALAAAAREGAERIRTAAEAVGMQADLLVTVVQQTRTSLDEASQALLMRVAGNDETVRQEAAAWLTSMSEQAKDLQANDADVAASALAVLDELRTEEIVPRLEAAEETIGTAADGTQTALQALGGTAAEGGAALAQSEEALTEAMTALETTAAPVPEAMDQIHQAVLTMRQQ